MKDVNGSRSYHRPGSLWVWGLSVSLLAGGCAKPGGGADSGKGWIKLFNGKNLEGWQYTGAPEKSAWQVASKAMPDPATANAAHQEFVITPGEGILVNGVEGRTCNIFTERTHGDCEAHIEFMVPKGSNSGVYFMGLYEIQVLDSFDTKDLTFQDCGGIYARWVNEQNVDGHAPRLNASKAPGEWQSFDVVFKAPRFDAAGNMTENARFVKVVHNGQVIHENVELKGPTRAALPGPEKALGPLMLQGDHGPVAYRNVRIRPLK